MAKPKQDKKREQRRQQEMVVDAPNAEEPVMGWYYYLEEPLGFPFQAKWLAPRPISPLHKGPEVAVVGLAPPEECEREMFIPVTWEHRTLAVPLAQLQTTRANKATRQAVEDWHDWVDQGYEF